MKSNLATRYWLLCTSFIFISTLLPCYEAFAEKAQLKTMPLWDYWYTVTAGTKSHYGYYEEKVEQKNSQIIMKVEYWKQEEEYINREDLGAVAQDDDNLSPLLFNFHSVYRTTETLIDGTIKDGRFFSARIKRGGQDLPIVQRSIPAKTFLSSLFPVWIGKKLANPPERFKEGGTINFQTFMEDNVDNGFQIQDGSLKWDKPDAFAQSSGTTKFQVRINGAPSIWWVDKQGAAVKIEMPEQKVIVNRVPKNEAKKFLDGAQ